MADRRHKGDSSDYRGLTYKERVQVYNMACNKLREYVRVMVEMDSTASMPAQQIIEARLGTLQKTAGAIRRLG